MKNIQKILIACVCLAAVMAMTVAGTLAYLTSRDSVKNTFTVGHVAITVDEAKVNSDGVEVANAERVKENEYHLIPGRSYVKDPTMTVKANSEESYVRMLLTIKDAGDLDAVLGTANKMGIFKGFDDKIWDYSGETVNEAEDTHTYEYRYMTTVTPGSEDLVLEPLFTGFSVPGTLTGEDLEKIADMEITVMGHAIQAYGFPDADAAWDAFDAQHNPATP